MAQNSYPFPPAVPGVPDGGSIATAEKWRRTARWMVPSRIHNGVGDDLVVTPSGANMTVTMGKGAAHLEGFYYENTANLTFTVAPSHPTLPRYDQIVLRLVLTGDTGSVTAQYVQGSPGNPAPRRTPLRTPGTFELVVADLYVPANSGTVSTASNPGREADGARARALYGSAVVPNIVAGLNNRNLSTITLAPVGWTQALTVRAGLLAKVDGTTADLRLLLDLTPSAGYEGGTGVVAITGMRGQTGGPARSTYHVHSLLVVPAYRTVTLTSNIEIQSGATVTWDSVPLLDQLQVLTVPVGDVAAPTYALL